MARASIQIMNLNKKKYNKIVKPMSHINIGSGREITIKELAKTIKIIVNYNGKIKFDITKPNGTSRKLVNISRLVKIGFEHKIDLEKGLEQVYMNFVAENLYKK